MCAGHPNHKGGLVMNCEQLWALFLATGLPEAYTLYCLLRDEEQNEKKTA